MVVGGSGFVGTRILRAALRQGVQVTSVSRSGSPPADVASSLPGVNWVAADVEDPAQLKAAVQNTDAVISCLGAFGSDAFMRRINGEANAAIAAASAEAGVERFVYVSAAPFGPIEKVLPGYFWGKRFAEAAVATHFGSRGTVLQPGMVYGTRRITASISLPLGLIGAPLEFVFGSAPVRALATRLGWLGAPLAPPISVDALAKAAVAAAVPGEGGSGGGGGGGGGGSLLEWGGMLELAERSPPEGVTLFYDGGCPLCRREIGYYQRLDSAARVTWLDIDADPSPLKSHGVTPEQAMALIHAVDADGRLQVGVPAFLAVWEQLPYWRVLPPLLRAVPMAIPLAGAAYSVWARNRLKLTGDARELDKGTACARK